MSDGLSASAFLLAVQLPAKVSDGFSSSVFCYHSGSLACRSFPHRQADEIFATFFHQGRDFFVQLSSVTSVLREEFAFLFQTFSRNDPPGKAPPSRGRSVFKKREEK